jgi:hypothetical protein
MFLALSAAEIIPYQSFGSHLGYRALIGIGFTPDNDLRIHGLLIPFP